MWTSLLFSEWRTRGAIRGVLLALMNGNDLFSALYTLVLLIPVVARNIPFDLTHRVGGYGCGPSLCA
jgi:hypothetical protein